MFKLKLYELNEELLVQENREIINKYLNEENKKLAVQVYLPLKKDHPSLEGYIKKLIIGQDHISYLDMIKNNMILNYLDIKERDMVIDLFKSMISKEPGYESIIKELKLKKSEQKKIIKTYEKVFSKRNNFYTQLIRATNTVNKNQVMNTNISQEQYSDEILKTIFPLKQQQQTFWIEDLKLERKILEYSRNKLNSLKELGIEQRHLEKDDKLIPNLKAIEEIQPGLFEYRMNTIDRIYG